MRLKYDIYIYIILWIRRRSFTLYTFIITYKDTSQWFIQNWHSKRFCPFMDRAGTVCDVTNTVLLLFSVKTALIPKKCIFVTWAAPENHNWRHARVLRHRRRKWPDQREIPIRKELPRKTAMKTHKKCDKMIELETADWKLFFLSKQIFAYLGYDPKMALF